MGRESKRGPGTTFVRLRQARSAWKVSRTGQAAARRFNGLASGRPAGAGVCGLRMGPLASPVGSAVCKRAQGLGTRRRFLGVMSTAVGYRIALLVVSGGWGAVVPYRTPAAGHYLYHGVPKVGSGLGDLFVKWDSYWYLDSTRIKAQMRSAASRGPHTN
jgi:hypothetical protein